MSYDRLFAPQHVYFQRTGFMIMFSRHDSVPNVPDIPGIDTLRGSCIHSRDYRSNNLTISAQVIEITGAIFRCRKPEVYRDRTVLLLGAFYSGLDISVDLAPFAKKV